MPVERDRIIGELAVQEGLVARDEVTRYYRLLDAQPGAPVTLAQLLVRDGRATPQDLERLKQVWQQRNGTGTGSSTAAPVRNGNGQAAKVSGAVARPSGRVAAPPPPMPGARPAAPAPAAPAASAALDANGLKKDELLARILISRNALTVERARDARNLQIQQRVRLGPLLVKQGFCDRARVEDAIRYIRESVVTCQRCATPQDKTRLPGGALKCPRCGGALMPASEDGSASAGAPLPASAPSPAPPIGAFSPRRPGSESPTVDSESATMRGVLGLGANDDPFASARVAPSGPPSRPGAGDPYDSRYGALRPPPPFGATGAPPAPMRLDTSQDELDPFIGKPTPPIVREASQDELNPFANPPSNGPGTRGPNGLAPSDMSRYGGIKPSDPGPPAFFNPPSAPVGDGHRGAPSGRPDFDEPPTMGLQGPPPGVAPSAFGGPPSSGPGAFGAPGAFGGPPAGFGAGPGADGGGFGGFGAPVGGSSGPLGLADPPAARGDTNPNDSDSPAEGEADDEAEEDEDDGKPRKKGGPTATRIDRSRRKQRDRDESPREPLPIGKILIVVGALAVVLGLGGVGAWLVIRSHRIDDNIAKGDAAYDKKDWKAARSFYQSVLSDQADNDRAIARRKDCDEKLEAILLDDEAQKRVKKSRDSADPNEAIVALTEDSKEQPLSEDQRKKLANRTDILVATARAKRRLADQLKRAGKKMEANHTLDEAAAALDQADQAKNANGQSDPIVLLEKVRLFEQRKSPNLEIAQKITDLAAADPDGWCGHYAKGRKESPPTVTNTAKLEEAILQFNAAIRDAPDPKAIPEAYYWRGKTKLRAGPSSRASARKDFQDAIDANGEDWRPYVELAKLILDENTGTGDAAPLLQRAAQLAPEEAEVLALQGELLFLQHRYDDAYTTLTSALRLDATLSRARRFRAYISIIRRSEKDIPFPTEFPDDLEQAINAFPDDIQLHDARARERFLHQKWRDAIVDFDVILATDARKGRDPAKLADLLRARAYCHIKVNERDKAVLDCQDAINLDPQNGVGHRYMGVVRLDDHNPLLAIESFDRAASLLSGEDRNDALVMRTEAKIMAKKFAEALTDTNKFLADNERSKYVKKALEQKKRCEDALQKEQQGQAPPEQGGEK